jgi:hypothetical protein
VGSPSLGSQISKTHVEETPYECEECGKALVPPLHCSSPHKTHPRKQAVNASVSEMPCFRQIGPLICADWRPNRSKEGGYMLYYSLQPSAAAVGFIPIKTQVAFHQVITSTAQVNPVISYK